MLPKIRQKCPRVLMLYPVYPTNSNLHEASFSPLWFCVVVVYHICNLGLKVYFSNWVFEFVIHRTIEVIFSASGNHSNNTRDTKDKFCPGFTLFAELRGRDTPALPRILRWFWTPTKIPSYINQATNINTCQIFLPKKYQNRKFQTSKNPSIIIPVNWNPEYPHWKA